MLGLAGIGNQNAHIKCVLCNISRMALLSQFCRLMIIPPLDQACQQQTTNDCSIAYRLICPKCLVSAPSSLAARGHEGTLVRTRTTTLVSITSTAIPWISRLLNG